MNLLDLKDKLSKGQNLGGEVVYIKEDNLLYGVESIYKDDENSNVVLLKSEQNSIKVQDLIGFLEKECNNLLYNEVLIGDTLYSRYGSKDIISVEFAQYETIKMIFINV